MRVKPEATDLWSAALGAAGTVIRYGHWGRPVLVFPSERGRAADFENNGMVGAVEGLIDAGRLKLYCVDSYDAASWSNTDIPLEERARRHGRYESWIVGDVVPWIYQDCGGQSERGHPRLQPGRLPRGQLRPQAGRPVPAGDVLLRQLRPRRRGTAGASGATRRTSTTRWTTWPTWPAITSTGCAASSACCWSAARASGRTPPGRCRAPGVSPRCSRQKGIRHELDLWGHDVPHDWPSWRAQLAHHMPRFC